LKPNNVHIAYLRRIEETMSVRAKRRKLAKAMKGCAANELERLWKSYRACTTWEESHAVVL
jgi:hypothetical protein